MRYNLDSMTADELSTLALAMDYLLCNSTDLPRETLKTVEELFYYLDAIAEEAEMEQEEQRLLEKTDNVLVVDFRPKAG